MATRHLRYLSPPPVDFDAKLRLFHPRRAQKRESLFYGALIRRTNHNPTSLYSNRDPRQITTQLVCRGLFSSLPTDVSPPKRSSTSKSVGLDEICVRRYSRE